MEARKLVGWNVRRLRVAEPYTIEELAEKAGVDGSFLARLERGQVNVGVVILDRLRRALGVRLTELFVEPAPGEKPPRPLPPGRRPRQSKSARR
ncbi:MAG: XRE family transcriptional regulator [Reyranella sp.]|uniref:helix-turn-helix domain-containing protein n=1 Tax=Reyranella sp. TaxID=1929291 RepID=UPI00120DC45D|nr:helix-turn-helix transcriptional regulator [Reyranella sp.]TAJ36874.1 MAG: XRE family transcriptional regulator [Reyranella sp.]